MKKTIQICGQVLMIAMIMFQSCKKESAPVTETGVYFPRVKNIIENRCLSCHSSAGTWTGRPVAFDTDSEIVSAHASIKAALVDPVTYMNKRMPEDGTLSQSDIDVIVKWYNKGGKATD